MANKKLLFLTLACGTIIFFGMFSNANAQCAGKSYGSYCTQSSGQPGICGGGGLCLPCGGAGNSCEDSCCSGFNCVSGRCESVTTPTPQTGATTNQTPVPQTGATAGVQPSGTGIVMPTGFGLPDPQGGIAKIIRNLLTWLLGIVGVIAIIGFVISGIQYLISAGNEDQMQSAKRNMLYAIVGVIVVLSSFVIIQAIQYALEARSMF